MVCPACAHRTRAFYAGAKGYGFGTRTNALQTKHERRARSYQTFGVSNPRCAAGGDGEASEAFVVGRRHFRDRYADCRRRMLVSETGIVWPMGTWQMHVIYGQPRAPRPPQRLPGRTSPLTRALSTRVGSAELGRICRGRICLGRICLPGRICLGRRSARILPPWTQLGC
ncbi:MAG: hypothetical protein OEY14_09455 [Myxococcales bacterium]|nr:hypothetical protein [Myxococcales bacterium]